MVGMSIDPIVDIVQTQINIGWKKVKLNILRREEKRTGILDENINF